MPKIQVEAKVVVSRTEEERDKRLFELVDLISDMFEAAKVDAPDHEVVPHEDAGDALIKVKYKGTRDIYVTECYTTDDNAAAHSEGAIGGGSNLVGQPPRYKPATSNRRKKKKKKKRKKA